mmetsp:Transcript_19924/g.41900  ORF Transcript_19924/g.41900 Transcript_19924/m.41900 type:complete len:229 (+) Transcript_19924:6344-7030(+)
MHRIGKLGNLILRHHFLKYVPLTNDASSGLLDEFRLPALGLGSGGSCLVGFCFGSGGEFGFHLGADGGVFLREFGGGSELFDFGFQFVGCSLDRHPSTVKCKRKKRILSPISLKLRPKDRLGQTKRMAQVQMPIAVRIRKCHDELFILFPSLGIVRGVALKSLLGFPERLDGDFVGDEGVSFRSSFGCGGDRQVGHFGGGGGDCWCHDVFLVMDDLMMSNVISTFFIV